MNISFTDIFKKTTGYFHSRRRKSMETVRNVPEDWGRLVIGFGILLIASVIGHVYFFYTLTSMTDELPAVTIVSDTIDRNALQKMSEFYSGREKRFEELKQTRLDVVDPSL